MRLLLTDSGHYLLPADLPESNVYDSQKEQQFLRSAVARHMAAIVDPKPRSINRRTALLSFPEAAEASRTVSGTMSDPVVPMHSPEKVTKSGDCSETSLLGEDQYFQKRDNSWFAQWSSIARDQTHVLDSFETLGLSIDEVKKMRTKYLEMPEEFYSKTKLPLITPQNFHAWLDTMKDGLEFQEIFSGSGRLSLSVLNVGLQVGFPVDYRYGWNVRRSKDRKLLDQLVYVVRLYSPRCSPWSSLSNIRRDKAALAEDRRAENPTLKWVADNVKRDALAKTSLPTASIIEQPQQSCMFEKSHLSAIKKIEGASTGLVDQCQYGAIDKASSLPTRKSTKFWHYRIRISSSFFRRCVGARRCKEHADLTCGRAGPLAVYPHQLDQSLAVEIYNHCRPGNVTTSHASSSIFWKCKACQHGIKKGGKHTYGLGCKFKPDRLPVPLGGVPLDDGPLTPGASSSGAAAAPVVAAPATDPVISADANEQPREPEAVPAPASAADGAAPSPEVDAAEAAPLPESVDVEAPRPAQASEPEPEVLDQPTFIEPSFDFKEFHRVFRG